MSPQFVDFDGDGDDDIVCGIYDGSPHVSYYDQDREGFLQPVEILDREGRRIVMNAWWNFDEKKWDETDRCDPEGGAPAVGHLTSAIAFDYDRDGDNDLVLGDHRGGYVYVRRNEGSDAAPQFATQNEVVLAAGVPMRVPGTVGTIRAVDWDGDGALDLMISGMDEANGPDSGGSVSVYLDQRASGQAAFGAAVTLIPARKKDARGSARQPDYGLYHEPVDIDGDGDLDLLVGGYSIWEPEPRKLTPAESDRVAHLQAQVAALKAAYDELIAQANKAREGLEGEAATEAFAAAYDAIRPQLAEVTAKLSPAQDELGELKPRTQRSSFTWLYENLTQ